MINKKSSGKICIVLIACILITYISSLSNYPIISEFYENNNDIDNLTPKRSNLEGNKLTYGFWPYWTNPSSYEPNWDALTYIAYFSWGANSDGTLSPPGIAQFNTVKTNAQQNSVKITICITCFDQNTQDSIFAYHKNDFANNVLDVLETYNVDGVNLDFEFPNPTNSLTGGSNLLLFEQLMEILFNTLKTANPNNHISFCVSGSVESIYRNNYLSQYTDAVFLMGYDYHWRSGPTTGAVSPYDDPNQFDIVDSVNRLTNYYLNSQIILGVPFYGYDWPCSSSIAGASTIGSGVSVLLRNAIINAQTYGRIWDSNSHTPWYRYQDGSEWHQCWYEDSESLGLKFDYVNLINLRGVGFWALGYETSDIWSLIISKFSEISNSLTGKIICIDPGDGGAETGVLGIDGPAFPNEEDFNLDVGLRLKEMLLYAGASVLMTRDSDIAVSIDQRCATANDNNADIFVSLQCNNLDSSTATRGSETYYWAESDVSYSVNGLNLASNIQTRIVSDLETTNRGAKGDYTTLGRHFDELSNTNMPSVMVYPVFLSNQEDFNLISNINLRSKIALAIFKGICDYFNEDLDIIPTTSDIIISGYTTPTSSVSRTLYFGQCISNAQLITRASWYLDGEHVEDLCFKEWLVNSDTISELKINTFDYNIGTHAIRIETTDLWGLENTYEQELVFYRTPIINSIAHGSSDAGKMVDDDDTTYASNDLGNSLYIELPCNYDIRAIKTHFWDGDNRYYQYKIEISTDNTTWTLVVDKTSGEHKSWQWDVINSKVRFIKITGTYNSQNQWWHVKEVQLFASSSPAFYIFGDVQGVYNLMVIDITNGESIIIDVMDNHYEFDLSILNFNYGDTIIIGTQDKTETFIITDPQTSIKIDFNISSNNNNLNGLDIADIIFIVIIIGLISTVIVMIIKLGRK
ncbi:MAG: N-acetylmuramoyl-L-alanine amidase [Promethearchaeota archaeon]